MPPAPDPRRRPGRLRTERRKLALAVGVFCATVGGYVAADRSRTAVIDASMPLPGVAQPSNACTLWFIGSSTIFRWQTLRRDVAPWNAHNRGVNGALIPQIVQWFANEPPGRPPAAIVFYAGENDIAAGATAAEAFASFRRFMAAKRARYGTMPVIAFSLKPSPGRWDQRPAQTAFNDSLRRYASARHDLDYIEIRPLMLVEGAPGPYYAPDGIHMSQAGYDRWTRTLRSALPRLLPRPVVDRCAPTGDRR